MNPDPPLDQLCRMLVQPASTHWRTREQAAGQLLAVIERQGLTDATLAAVEAIAADPKWEVRAVLADHLLSLPEDHLIRFAELLAEDDNQIIRTAVQRAQTRHRKGMQTQARRRRGLHDIHAQYDQLERNHGRIAAEQALRMAERLFDVTLGGAVHEIRGVLTPLLSAVDTLEAQAAAPIPDSKVLRRQVPRVLDRLHLLQDLVEDMRDFAQATPADRTQESLARLVAEARHLVVDWFAARHLDLKPIHFEIAIPDRIVVPVCRLPMLMAVRNLLKNAVESLATGQLTFRAGSIRVRAVVVDGWAILEIADTGAGLSADELAEIEEFVPGRCSRKTHGTGFGLPFAYRKIRDHGGALVLSSAIDEGTTVTVSLPLTPTEDESHADSRSPQAARPGR